MLFGLFFVVLLQLHTLVHSSPTEPILPSNDAFYKAPKDIEKYSLGDVIRLRPSPASIRAVYHSINVKNAWQFLIRSEDSRGKPIAFVTTVLQPYNATSTKVLSYQFAQDSPSIDCSPSYSILHGANMNTIILQFEMYVVATALMRGYYVIAPDHEGPDSAFAMSRIAGKITLDSIRGVLQTGHITGIDEDAKVAMWGYSGGTIPTSWAAILQPEYAPELTDNLVGAAVGGWLTNLSNSAERMDGTFASGIIPLAVHGLLNQYPELGDQVRGEIIEPEDLQKFESSKTMCLADAFPAFAFKNYFSGDERVFRSGHQIFNLDGIKQAIAEHIIGVNKSDGVPQIPLFAYHGVQDEIIPHEQALFGFNKLCEFGVKSFEFSLSNNTGHFGEMLQGCGAGLRWIEDRLEGKPAVDGCVHTIRQTNLEYPNAAFSFYEAFRTSWESVLGWELGRFRASKIPTPVSLVFSAVRKFFETLGPVPL